jgi:flagellar protein FlaJ
MYFKTKYKKGVYAVSIGVAAVIFLLLLLQGQYIPQSPYFIPMNMKVNNAFALCILVAIIPPAIIEFNNSVWLKQVDKNLPRLLRDVTESIRSGMPLVRALEVASKRSYGPLTQILETAMVNFNLTSDLDSSLKWLGESLIRPSGKRMATILLEAEKSGGRMLDVLDTSINMFTSIDEYRDEKESVVGPYVLMVYVSSLIFLFIGWVIINQFLTPLANQNLNIPGVASLIGKMLSIDYYKSIIFWAAIMEGLIGGLVAGKITDSRVASGLIHSVILILITIVFFSTLVV